jgi:hypothetical protein
LRSKPKRRRLRHPRRHPPVRTGHHRQFTLGVITFGGKGQPGLNSGKAAEFRYLLSETENPGEDDDEGFDL